MSKVDFKKKADGIYSLSVIGMVCPHPQLYTKKAMTKLAKDDILEVEFDNTSSGEAIDSISKSVGFEISSREKSNNNYIWKLKKL
ncbi:MAG: sulfurtransferase TusA family protein [Nitrospirae bacterium]|nr:sulfurtransferase TusA family protein [Nitrospirota bacterium]MBF0540759.1 sulfurtransferase TusA family protein [Nitrospirota bacterium]